MVIEGEQFLINAANLGDADGGEAVLFVGGALGGDQDSRSGVDGDIVLRDDREVFVLGTHGDARGRLHRHEVFVEVLAEVDAPLVLGGLQQDQLREVRRVQAHQQALVERVPYRDCAARVGREHDVR